MWPERKINNFKRGGLKMTIEKHGNYWVVYNKDKTKALGVHRTKEDAVKQLRAVELSKLKKKRGGKNEEK